MLGDFKTLSVVSLFIRLMHSAVEGRRPYRHAATIQTHNYYTDTRLLYRHTTTIQTHDYYTETQLLCRHDYYTDTQLLLRSTEDKRGTEDMRDTDDWPFIRRPCSMPKLIF